MGSVRPLLLLCALPVLAACTIDDVELDSLSCPCAAGWVCVDSVCIHENEVPDAARPADLGPPDAGVDLGIDQGTDAGVVDLGAPHPDQGAPDADSDAMTPVDCTPLMTTENVTFCGATRETCSVEAQNMTTCDSVCAVVGLVCLEAYDDVNPGCGPDLDAPTTCDDDTRVAYHCLCIRG